MSNKLYLFAFKDPFLEVGICLSYLYNKDNNVIYNFDSKEFVYRTVV